MIDEDTYVQQGRDLERAYSLQVINYILGTLQPDTDLAMVGYPFTDEVSHQFMGLVTPTDADGGPNPCYDVTPKFDDAVHRARNGRPRRDPRGLHPQRLRGCRREARHRARADGRQPDDVRRLRPRLRAAVVRGQREHGAEPATVGGVSLHASSDASNCSAVGGAPVAADAVATDDIAKACWAGGTIQIYINPNRLSAAQPTSATFPTYEEVRDRPSATPSRA